MYQRKLAPIRVRKERVIDVALSTFLDAGFGGASVDKIALLSGVSKPTIYRWFGSKEGLFEAVSIRGAEAVGVALNWLDDDERSPEIVLRQAATEIVKTMHHTTNRELQRITLAEARRFPELSNNVRTLTLARIAPPLERYFRRLAESRKSRMLGQEPFLANMFILVAAHGLKFLYSTPTETDADFAHVDLVVDLFLKGILQPDQPELSGQIEVRTKAPGGRRS